MAERTPLRSRIKNAFLEAGKSLQHPETIIDPRHRIMRLNEAPVVYQNGHKNGVPNSSSRHVTIYNYQKKP